MRWLDYVIPVDYGQECFFFLLIKLLMCLLFVLLRILNVLKLYGCSLMIWKLLLCQITKVNPRELNPYFKDNGTGYPEESDRTKSDIDKLPPPRIVGDGGASWRLKALKRAEEQAARDGRRLKEACLLLLFFLYTR